MQKFGLNKASEWRQIDPNTAANDTANAHAYVGDARPHVKYAKEWVYEALATDLEIVQMSGFEDEQVLDEQQWMRMAQSMAARSEHAAQACGIEINGGLEEVFLLVFERAKEELQEDL
ncbi:hypothetical protein [Tritonibacter mobilis]|uniref:hypothetical protein n=1 Tax=Tritonibacter mobilis TaxID=379347 RepID=UPI000E0D39B2|nr:hypothetical protein [Tritonibacter mobilis]